MKKEIAVETNYGGLEQLKKTLADMGFKRDGGEIKFANINGEGCYLKGTFTGEYYTVKDDYDKEHNHYKFANAEGIGLDKDGNQIVLEKGDYVLFRSGLLDYMLKDKANKEVCIIYTGKKVVNINGKKCKVNQYEMLVKNS